MPGSWVCLEAMSEKTTRLRGEHHPGPRLIPEPRRNVLALRPRTRRGFTDHSPLRCLLVDDNHHFLSAARKLLEHQGIIVTGLASTTAEALWHAETEPPDVVLVDISLGTESGVDLAHRLAAGQGPAVILISTHRQDDLDDVVAAGPALAVLPKMEVSGTAVREIYQRCR
jgi:two-component system, NarL family, nitrate/nitrite response regulator NarL